MVEGAVDGRDPILTACMVVVMAMDTVEVVAADLDQEEEEVVAVDLDQEEEEEVE